MEYMTKESIQNRLNEHYEIAKTQGEVFAVFLQGSQNYITDKFFKNSDVDSKGIFIPTKREICLGYDISKPELILENEEHLDRYDVRKFVSLLKKPSINNLEILFSDYFVINETYKGFHEELVSIREEIARANEKQFLMATAGMSQQDLKKISNRTGNQDSDIEKYGYSRKRLSNVIRFNETVKKYISGAGFQECLRAMDQELIYKIRRTEFYGLEEALKLAEEKHNETYALMSEFEATETNAESVEKLNSILIELLSTRFK